jgi:hypothetical protein
MLIGYKKLRAIIFATLSLSDFKCFLDVLHMIYETTASVHHIAMLDTVQYYRVI